MMVGKAMKLVGVGTVALVVSGLGIRESWEYLQVAHGKVEQTIRDGIPVGAEIDRLNLLVDKLDNEIGSKKRDVARAAVALEDYEQKLVDLNQQLDSSKRHMTDLRTALESERPSLRFGCSVYSQVEVEQALRSKLNDFKAKSRICEQMERAVELHRTTYQQLSGRLAERQRERDLLAQKVQTLEAERQSLALSAQPDSPLLDSDTLARAKELADQIENRLRTERKLQQLDVNSIDSISQPTPQVEFSPVDEFDRLFGEGEGA